MLPVQLLGGGRRYFPVWLMARRACHTTNTGNWKARLSGWQSLTSPNMAGFLITGVWSEAEIGSMFSRMKRGG